MHKYYSQILSATNHLLIKEHLFAKTNIRSEIHKSIKVETFSIAEENLYFQIMDLNRQLIDILDDALDLILTKDDL